MTFSRCQETDILRGGDWDDPSIPLVSFDPGTTCVGMALYELDPIRLKIRRCEAKTFIAKNSVLDRRYASIHGEKNARLHYLRNKILDELIYFGPHYAFCEDTYYNRLRPSAYGPLVESTSSLRSAVEEYDPLTPLRTIESSSAKKTLHIKGSGPTLKDKVREAVLACSEIADVYSGNLYECDEHSFDSLLIGYCGILMLREELRLSEPKITAGVIELY